MKVFINPGHGGEDPGACGNGLREADVAKEVADLVERYLTAAGVDVVGNEQIDSLVDICEASDDSGADIFVSIHCNSANTAAHGTETFYYYTSKSGVRLADCIQAQIVNSLHTTDRGAKPAEPGRNGLYVLTNTEATSVLVELAFIDNAEDSELLRNCKDDFARAIARGITDYEQGMEPEAVDAPSLPDGMASPHFSIAEVTCHCCGEGLDKVSPRLLDLLEQLRENIGGPIELSCVYRCPSHNAEVGGVPNSQHVLGTAADIQTPNYPDCHTPEQLLWYCQQLPFDGLGLYDWGVHVDVRDGGINSGIYWEG